MMGFTICSIVGETDELLPERRDIAADKLERELLRNLRERRLFLPLLFPDSSSSLRNCCFSRNSLALLFILKSKCSRNIDYLYF
jgi:hypothetical protein